MLTSKCALRHNGVHFFDISTSKSAPRPRCFVHFHFEMCFVPQRRALFGHLNFQKWSGAGAFCTFWLRNVLRATTACTFSTSQLPKAVRHWGALYILASKCASRHTGARFFISHLARWLHTRRFSEPTFRPSGATSHWKPLPRLCFSSVHIVGSLASKLPSIKQCQSNVVSCEETPQSRLSTNNVNTCKFDPRPRLSDFILQPDVG